MPKQETPEQLAKIARDATDKLRAIEIADRVNRNKPLLGRTFKYRNSYSCPDKASDYWWMYVKITGLSDDGVLVATSFQTCKYRRFSIEPDLRIHNIDAGYVAIRPSEFAAAWQSAKRKLDAMI